MIALDLKLKYLEDSLQYFYFITLRRSVKQVLKDEMKDNTLNKFSVEHPSPLPTQRGILHQREIHFLLSFIESMNQML